MKRMNHDMDYLKDISTYWQEHLIGKFSNIENGNAESILDHDDNKLDDCSKCISNGSIGPVISDDKNSTGAESQVTITASEAKPLSSGTNTALIGEIPNFVKEGYTEDEDSEL